MTEANKIQIGGDHYKNGGQYEHWDVVSRNGVGYLEGYATKYLARWRQKNGIQDLKKARHATVKLLELIQSGHRKPMGVVSFEEIYGFSNAYDLWMSDETACTFLFTWREEWQVKIALEAIDRTINRAKEEGWKDET